MALMISKEEIEHLKDLARADFDVKETEKLAKDLGEILSYVEELKGADVSSAPEMTHALEGVKNIFRADLNKQSESAGDLINAFPKKEKNYLKVQSIL